MERFEMVTRKYNTIMEETYNCESVKAIIVNNNLAQEDIYSMENVIEFIRVIGTGTNFAREIYNALRDYKKANPAPLSESERALIRAINEYYGFTVLDTLDTLQCINGEANPRFNRMVVQDMKSPAKTAFRWIENLYVPALYTMEKTIQFKAVVSAIA